MLSIETAIIIVNYKDEHRTINYVKNELSKILVNYYLIIVNNAATVESNLTLSESLGCIVINDCSCFPKTHNKFILSSKENLGFAKGNNLGAVFTKINQEIKYLLFSNNDVRIISTNVLEVLINKLKSNTDIGMIGPNCTDMFDVSQSPRPYISFCNKFIFSYWLTVLPKKYKIKIFKFDYPQKANEGDHYKISGSFFLARASDYFECEMMDPNTFLYCEEEILTERMYLISKRVYYCPNVKVVHEQGQVTGKFFHKKEKMIIDFESNSYYYKRYKKVSRLMIELGRINHYAFSIFKNIL